MPRTPEQRARQAAQARVWRKANPERHKANLQRGARKHILRTKYNMTEEDYDVLFKQQEGKCAICIKPAIIHDRLSIDHCHKTGKIRGLLCQKCNSGLAALGDDEFGLIRALWYLAHAR